MNKERLINLLDDMQETAISRIVNAKQIADRNKVSYYEEQLELVKEIKAIITEW